jgi:hypothetical protein
MTTRITRRDWSLRTWPSKRRAGFYGCEVEGADLVSAWPASRRQALEAPEGSTRRLLQPVACSRLCCSLCAFVHLQRGSRCHVGHML